MVGNGTGSGGLTSVRVWNRLVTPVPPTETTNQSGSSTPVTEVPVNLDEGTNPPSTALPTLSSKSRFRDAGDT